MVAEYLKTVSDTEKRIVELEASTEGWKKVKETSHCVISSRPSEDFKGNIYKSEGIIPAPATRVFDFVYPGVEKPKRKEWDPSVASSVVIDRPASDVDVIVSRTAPVCWGLISAREFVDIVKVTREPTRIFTSAISVTHPNAPDSKGFIRGFNYPNALFCYMVNGKPDETRLVQYVHTDLGGMLPQSLVESAIPSAMADIYPRLTAALASLD